MGWFEHGSTIIVFARQDFDLCEGVREGTRIRMGQPLMRRRGARSSWVEPS
jgi:phosphatidylserine decarboxylase